ncbi:MAG: pyrroline-5-carboxylate reductase [Pseudolabrys sp.]|nr:pyrroline-5-carboxylate reductase [Pseudolabrys sp.]
MATANTKPLQTFRGTLILAGAGKMGGAMLAGWLKRGLDPKHTTVIEPAPVKAITALTKRGLTINPAKARGAASVIVLGVKPQIAPEALPPLVQRAGKGTLVVSIMAGRTVDFLQKSFPSGTAIVRAMPNLPASIGRGITVAVANKNVTPAQRKLAGALLSAAGTVEWVNDEKLLDAVTAVSGSGPAYVFLLAETLAAAAVEAGLPKALAAKLSRETVSGSGELLRQSTLDAAVLRQNVTSPGGTTAAALEVLMGPGGFETLLATAVAKATKRSRELAG